MLIKYSNRRGSEGKRQYKPFPVALKTLLVENLNSDRKRFKTNPHILINITFVNSPKSTLPQDVIGAEALCNSLEFIKSESNHMGVEDGIFS